jgi:Protein of unknown function (DUF4013)
LAGVRLVAESFAWPFRGAWRSAWAIGLVTVLLVPVLFVPLLGYAIAATRAAEIDPSPGPPPWRWSLRLLWDGAWTAAAILIITAPFVLVLNPIVNAVVDAGWFDNFTARVLVILALALPWGIVLLILMPHATARFARTGIWGDLFDFVGAIKSVRRDFATWNAVAAAIVTAWAIGLACVGLLCVGVVPGIFYAILVSAHAAAALHRQSSGPSPAAG